MPSARCREEGEREAWEEGRNPGIAGCSTPSRLLAALTPVHGPWAVAAAAADPSHSSTEGPFLPCRLGWPVGHLLPWLSCRYHLMYKPPPTMEIQARLLQNPKDAEEQVKFKVDLFYRNSTELEKFYKQAITVNGDQDLYTVFEHIESGIIHPLPNKVL